MDPILFLRGSVRRKNQEPAEKNESSVVVLLAAAVE